MTTPFLKAIRNRFPKAEISYLVGNYSKKILDGNKNIDRVINFDDDIVYKKKVFDTVRLIKQIKKERFDLCFVLDKSYHWGILSYFFGIKNRIGFDRHGEGFAYHKTVFFDGGKYELEYNLDLAKLVNAKISDKKMELFISKLDEQFSEEIINKNALNSKIMIGIAPGGAKNPGQEMDAKRWPIEKYIELTKELIKNNNVLIFGGPGDIEFGKKITSEIKSDKIIDLTGKTTIQQSAALIDRCKYFITHDSGLMHIAATTNTKIIALFGPTPAHRFAPKDASVIQIEDKECPCYDVYGNYKKCKNVECMNQIRTKDILEIVNNEN